MCSGMGIKMKRLSMRAKITLWFTAALIMVVLFTYFIMLTASNQILQKTIRDSLVETVENNYNEIRYYGSMEEVAPDKDASHFLRFENGILEVNDDFLDAVNQVYTGLYDDDGTLIYGENPVSGSVSDIKFMDSRIQSKKVKGVRYYIFDRKLSAKGMEGLWMRGVVSEAQGTTQMTGIIRLSVIILPLLVLVAAVGGYFLVKGSLRPLQQISETAVQIGRENDLKKRIDIGAGKDELHQLADTFNDMLDKLEKAFETERQFISDASHELRTPMSVISAQCEMSLEQRRSPEEYEKALQVISRQSRKLSKLINDMLEFTRLEAGADRYKKEPVDMTELTASLCEDMALIRENGITLTYEAQEKIMYTGNRELLSRLLMNLVSNAYRYGKKDGHIVVSLRKEKDAVLLSVTDDGIGIAREEQEKIFRRFYQTDNSRFHAGIGLGLAMAKEIVHFHGGEITVESRIGEGSTFLVRLPC